jgi:hypothetical protein
MTQCGKDQGEFAELESQLRELNPVDPGDAFFADQREVVQLQLQLQALPLSDPGDLFFHRQAKAIRRSLAGEAREGFWAIWARPLAAAAALFFLVLGVARITHRQDYKMPAGWTMALEQLAAEDDPGLEDIEELNDEQLKRLAGNLEGSILAEAGDRLMEEPVDLDDLNEQELDLLTRRLEAKRQT